MDNKLTMYFKDKEYGKCGEMAPFNDSNDDNLYTGDIVHLFSIKTHLDYGLTSIVKDNGKIFVMGIEQCCPNAREEGWEIYKEKSYMSMKDGDVIDGIKYKQKDEKAAIKEMTIEEIEKELGYQIKIVKK